MYKAVIFYFSGTGNTWWVADRIKKQLDAKNINADTVSIETVDAKKADWWIKTADLVFFGWPVYGSDLPDPMKRFIDNLNVVKKGKHVHTFCTQLKFSGDGAWLYHKHFEAKGLIIDSGEHFEMPSNLSIWRGPLGSPRNDAKTQQIMDRCDAHIAQYMETLLTGKARIKGKYSCPLGILQRAPYRLFFGRLRNLMGINQSRCRQCGQCASLCPAGNIKLNEYPSFEGKCCLCMRCYAFCPASAITVYGKSHNTEKNGKPYSIKDPRFTPSLLK